MSNLAKFSVAALLWIAAISPTSVRGEPHKEKCILLFYNSSFVPNISLYRQAIEEGRLLSGRTSVRAKVLDMANAKVSEFTGPYCGFSPRGIFWAFGTLAPNDEVQALASHPEELDRPENAKALTIEKLTGKRTVGLPQTWDTKGLVNEVDGSVLVEIPGGDFSCGPRSDDTAGIAKFPWATRRKSNVQRFLMGKYEVTRGQYEKFCSETGYPNHEMFGFLEDTSQTLAVSCRPVEGISLPDAVAYCKWAGGRLPSKEEYLRAAGGMEGLPYPWGEQYNPECVALERRSSTPVWKFPYGASPEGCMHLLGNVSEWLGTATSYRDKNGLSHEGYYYVGGSYEDKSDFAVRSYGLYGAPADARSHGLGFRLAKDTASQ